MADLTAALEGTFAAGPPPHVALALVLDGAGEIAVLEPIVPLALTVETVAGDPVAVDVPAFDGGVRPRVVDLAPGAPVVLRSPVRLLLGAPGGGRFAWRLAIDPVEAARRGGLVVTATVPLEDGPCALAPVIVAVPVD